MMLYSKIHSLVYRAINKIRKIKKRRSWETTPSHPQTTYFGKDCQLFEPHLVGPSTLSADCHGTQSVRGVLSIIDKLSADKYLEFVKNYYRQGLQNFGDKWVYADINTVLYGICKNVLIESYLEIGVRRGRSMAIVASLSPNCRIVGFDMWIQNYAGLENPGKDFVKEELNKIGYKGEPEFIDGNSKVTIPKYFRNHPDAYFDLVTVDGDHSVGGAAVDLANVIPRLKVGGFLVFDDISSHEHPYLKGVWNKLVAKNKRFSSYSFTELGLGVGFVIKRY